jgi:hypothetical protein
MLHVRVTVVETLDISVFRSPCKDAILRQKYIVHPTSCSIELIDFVMILD